MNEPQKHGFVAEPIVPSDAVFGSAWNLEAKGFKGVQLVPDGNWEPYLFDLIYSHQAPKFETNSCVTHGSLNAIELLANRMHSRLLDFSDRFVAKTSGTDPARGNTPKAVADAIRHKWSVLESDWPMEAARTVDEFYADIPSELFDLALDDKGKYSFGYERVDPPTIANLKEALKYSPVGISCALTWAENGLWKKPEGWRDVHWGVLLRIKDNGNFVILDSYPDDKGSFLKECLPFAPEVAMRYALDYEKYEFFTTSIPILAWIAAWWAKRSKKPDLPQTPPVKPRETGVPEEKAPEPDPATERLRKEALRWIGRDAAPLNLAPQELACAESICTIVASSIEPDFPKDITSTAVLAEFLDNSERFERITTPKPGCIIISPREGKTPGHAGIFLTENRIASNDSKRGTFEDNYTFSSWISSFKKGRGLRIFIWEPK